MMRHLNLLSLTGRRALVTGAGTGIGRMIATGLAEAGADLLLVGRRAEPLEATAHALRRLGSLVEVIPGDITVERDIQHLADLPGDIDILVNNAGIAPKHPWKTEPLEGEWRRTFAVNVDATFRLCQVFAPPMMERRWGRIINISSMYGRLGGNPALYPGMEWDEPAYFASKHAVHGITHYLAPRLAPYGVSINSLSPGAFAGSEQNQAAGMEQGDMIDVQHAAIPMRRYGSDDDIKGVAVMLASAAASYLTGQDIVVDGGFTVW
jgi:NAD(P)-dependent dehydrogenase (short-subunit alcohol dehydrogenase family)